MMRLFAKGLAPPVHIFEGGISESRAGRKRRRLPPHVTPRHNRPMPDYRRHRVPGGTCFFTVNLLERRNTLLVNQVDALRDAVRKVRAARPFHIVPGLCYPTTCMPSGPCRPMTPTTRHAGGRSRSPSPRPNPRPNAYPRSAPPRVNAASGNDDSGNTRSVTSTTTRHMSITFTSTR